jgi:leucyl aminopeptidase (aminopeptidase T)
MACIVQGAKQLRGNLPAGQLFAASHSGSVIGALASRAAAKGLTNLMPSPI